MKRATKDLQAVTRGLKALVKKTEKLVKAVDKMQKAQNTKEAKPARKAAKKTLSKKTAAKKAARKTTAVTATDQVLKIIKRSKKGVDVPTLKKKTGLGDRTVRNIVFRASKQGKIKIVARGVYVGA